MWRMEPVVHAGSQPERDIRAVAVAGGKLRIANEIGNRVREALGLQDRAVEHLSGGADNAVARAGQDVRVVVDRACALFQLARKAIVQAVKMRLAGLAQIEVGEQL